MHRQRMLHALQTADPPWDVVIIGGGATGLGAAVDASSRGYRVALLESHDFAKGTSSRSTKLIHGGVRYLRQGQVQMVRQSLLERGRLLRNAPHVVHSRRFVIPSYQRGGRWYFYAGMKAYDLLAGQLGYEWSQLLSSAQTVAAFPNLKATGLHGGVLYSDGQFDDARLAITLAQTCAAQGGILLNYAPVVRLLTESGRVAGVVAHDQESGAELVIRGRAVINATGVFGESIMELDSSTSAVGRAEEAPRPQIVASQGTHLVLPQRFAPSQCAMLIPHTDDARVLFAIPWYNRCLFGTTDHRVLDIASEPRPLEREIDYLLEHAARYLTEPPRREDILSVFAGLRPLVGARRTATGEVQAATAKLSREHEIFTSPAGLISIIGGKWTTYRKMGQDVIDLAERVAQLPGRPSQTSRLALHAAPPAPATAQADGPALDDPLAVYGTERGSLLEAAERDASFAQELSRHLPYIMAQVVWAVEHEMARTLEDVLARRLRALLLDARASLQAAAQVAQLMQRLLQRDDAWRAKQLADYQRLVENYLP